MSAELFATVMIVAVILVAMISYLGMIKSKDWKNRYHSLLDRYDNAYKELNTQRNLNNALSTKITQLEKKIKCLEIELKQEKKRNGTNTSIDKTNSIKEEVSRLKGSEHISRSKAVRYITQHSNFSPTQMNNQSTDSILDYYWYLYLMNSFIDNNETQKKDESYEYTNSSTTEETESYKESTNDDSNSTTNDSWSSNSDYNSTSSSYSSDSSSDSNSSSSWGYSSDDSSYSSGSSSSYSDYSSSSYDSSSYSGSDF